MAYGFDEDKSKKDIYKKDEVYSKEEVYSKDDINKMLVVKTERFTIVPSLASNDRAIYEFTMSSIPTGYTPIGVVGSVVIKSNARKEIAVNWCRISSYAQKKIQACCENKSSMTQTDMVLHVQILCAKPAFVNIIE